MCVSVSECTSREGSPVMVVISARLSLLECQSTDTSFLYWPAECGTASHEQFGRMERSVRVRYLAFVGIVWMSVLHVSGEMFNVEVTGLLL